MFKSLQRAAGTEEGLSRVPAFLLLPLKPLPLGHFTCMRIAIG